MEEIKYYYVRCEWCKNIEPHRIDKLPDNLQRFLPETAEKYFYYYCECCKKRTLQRIMGYDI